MNVKQSAIEAGQTENLSKLMNHSVKNYADGVRLLAVAMIENARDAAKRGDADAQAFLTEWRDHFADRHHA